VVGVEIRPVAALPHTGKYVGFVIYKCSHSEDAWREYEG
jgi:hypothetical protein